MDEEQEAAGQPWVEVVSGSEVRNLRIFGNVLVPCHQGGVPLSQNDPATVTITGCRIVGDDTAT